VLLLDADTMVRRNIDHVLRSSLVHGRDLVYTHDLAMVAPNARAPPVQGGFLLVRPSLRLFEQLVAVALEGDFRPGSGWGKSNIGWSWGGQTIQGLLAYFFHALAPPNASEALDPCLYNAMETIPNCSSGETAVPAADVFLVHFTACQKPWSCIVPGKPKCRAWHKEWWGHRNQLALRHGANASSPCCRRCALLRDGKLGSSAAHRARTFEHLPIPLPDGRPVVTDT